MSLMNHCKCVFGDQLNLESNYPQNNVQGRISPSHTLCIPIIKSIYILDDRMDEWEKWVWVAYADKILKEQFTKNENLLKMYSSSGHSIFRWVCFFIRTDLKKCVIPYLAHHWILCSEWVPSEWESKQLIKHQSTSNPHPCSPSVNVLWSQNLCVCEKQIQNCCFWLKYDPSIHNMTFSSEKSPTRLNQEIKHHLHAENSPWQFYTHTFWCILMWKDNRG